MDVFERGGRGGERRGERSPSLNREKQIKIKIKIKMKIKMKSCSSYHQDIYIGIYTYVNTDKRDQLFLGS